MRQADTNTASAQAKTARQASINSPSAQLRADGHAIAPTGTLHPHQVHQLQRVLGNRQTAQLLKREFQSALHALKERQPEAHNRASASAPPIQRMLDWSKTRVVKRSEAGAFGVYFLEDGERQGVLKASDNIREEVFLTRLASMFGLKTPTMEIISSSHKDYGKVLDVIGESVRQLNEQLEKAKLEEGADEDPTIMEKQSLDLSGAPPFILMDQLAATSLQSLVESNEHDNAGKAKMVQLLGPENDMNATGKQFFFDLGKLIAVDLASRNGDRFDWSVSPDICNLMGFGEGPSEENDYLGGENLGNVMLGEHGEMIAIDPIMSRQDMPENYPDAVETIVTTMMDDLVKIAASSMVMIGYRPEGAEDLIRQGIVEADAIAGGIEDFHLEGMMKEIDSLL